MSGTVTCTARPAFGHALSDADSAAVPPLCWAVSPCSWCSLAPSHIIANRRRCQRLHACTQVCQANWDAVTDCARCTLASWHVAYHAALLLTTAPPPTTTPPPAAGVHRRLLWLGPVWVPVRQLGQAQAHVSGHRPSGRHYVCGPGSTFILGHGCAAWCGRDWCRWADPHRCAAECGTCGTILQVGRAMPWHMPCHGMLLLSESCARLGCAWLCCSA
jgi:hypothetical protein